jgi:hypothetical protein
MKTATLLALSLALLAPAAARAEKATDDSAATPAKPKAKGKAKDGKESKKGAKAEAEPEGKSKAAMKMEEMRRKAGKPDSKQVANAKERAAAARAKSLFVFAVETCDKPDRCDPMMRDDTERQFLNACRLCAPPEKCEAERDAIRAGQSTRRGTVCEEQ